MTVMQVYDCYASRTMPQVEVLSLPKNIFSNLPLQTRILNMQYQNCYPWSRNLLAYGSQGINLCADQEVCKNSQAFLMFVRLRHMYMYIYIYILGADYNLYCSEFSQLV